MGLGAENPKPNVAAPFRAAYAVFGCCGHSNPCCDNIEGEETWGELLWWELVCFTYLATYTPPYLSISSPFPSHPSLLATTSSQGPMSGSDDGPKASCLVLIEWEARQKQRQRLVVFGGVSNSEHFQLQFRFRS